MLNSNRKWNQFEGNSKSQNEHQPVHDKSIGDSANTDIKTEDSWHTTNIEEIFSTFNSSVNGLSGSEAEKRLKQYGPNQLTEKK